MQWRVQCFAGLRELIGVPEFLVDLPEGATARDLKRTVEDLYPPLRLRMGAVRVAAAFDFLDDHQPLPPGSDLALIPPVSGGSEADNVSPWVRLVAEPLSLDQAVRLVRGEDAGAIVTFTGTVRAASRGQEVTRLEYEAYGAMALDRMRRIVREAGETSGPLRAALFHRVGVVAVGEASVVIAVAAPHRDAAFQACRAIIEALKADVPIWKKEFYTSGATWVGWGS